MGISGLTDEEIEEAALLVYAADMPKAKLGGRGIRTNETRDVLEAAIERTRECFRRFDETFVSFSGGKDSTAMLNVAIEAARLEGLLPVTVRFWDEEALPAEVEEYVRRVAARDEVVLEWYCLPIAHRNACSVEEPLWYPWGPESEELWCRPLPPEGITETDGCPDWWTYAGKPDKRPSIPVCNSLYAVTRPGTVCALVGNRAQESLRRRSIILRRPVDSHLTHQVEYGAKNLYLSYPIYDWNTVDVWTAIANGSWDYCEFYDAMEMLGVARNDQRLGPPFGEEPLGRLWTYREIDPLLWDKLSKRVPGANTAAMYSRTVLYGYGEGEDQALERKEGMTWEETLADAIRDHDPSTRKAVAEWVGQFISLHYRKTTDPILEVPHPITAVSWPWLYRLALRGDMKKRREPPYTTDRAIFVQRYRRYQEALEKYLENPDG